MIAATSILADHFPAVPRTQRTVNRLVDVLANKADRAVVIDITKHAGHAIDISSAARVGNRMKNGGKVGRIGEEFVFKALRGSHHWKSFTQAERLHAIEHIEYFRRLFDQ